MATILVTHGYIRRDVQLVTWRRRHHIAEPIVGVLGHLPPEGSVWPPERRAAFLTMLTAMLDCCYEDEDATDARRALGGSAGGAQP